MLWVGAAQDSVWRLRYGCSHGEIGKIFNWNYFESAGMKLQRKQARNMSLTLQSMQLLAWFVCVWVQVQIQSGDWVAVPDNDRDKVVTNVMRWRQLEQGGDDCDEVVTIGIRWQWSQQGGNNHEKVAMIGTWWQQSQQCDDDYNEVAIIKMRWQQLQQGGNNWNEVAIIPTRWQQL